MSNDRLKVVDAFDLDDELRTLLRPGEMVRDEQGRRHRLPRYFYEIAAHEEATNLRLTPHFGMNEFVLVDLREHPRLQGFPRYIPCAVRVLAFYLEQFRAAAGASAHMWGTAADIYRIGTNILKTKELIERFNDVAEDLSDDLTTLPYGHVTGKNADDHVHIDLGYITVVPREISEDRMEMPQESRPRFAFEERRRRERRAAIPAGSAGED